ncbi:MAG TPA: 4Fe-4S binding protein [Clostridiales bacterium]|nr:4Fe-4S binding protein [Clostridiales bacterium]
MIRKIIQIDEEKCNGCGLCVPNCAEGALQIIDGKARLVKDQYCDGLGACLGHCPQDALHIIEREAEEFDEEAAMEFVKSLKESRNQEIKAESNDGHFHSHENHNHMHMHMHGGGCPGSRVRTFNQDRTAIDPETAGSGDIAFSLKSQLQQWPVQLMLVPVQAPYFKNADLLITADCVPYSFADYHPKLLKGKRVVIGCPKLDDLDFYIEKLTAIIKENDLKSITVAFMEVPCCSGMVYAAQQAVLASGKDLKVNKVRITIDGKKQEV